MLDPLDEALSAGLIREEGNTYQFTHALVRQAVAAELSLPRKQLLHLRAAEAIERVHAQNLDPYVAELAYHFWQATPAGGADRAVLYSRRAGDQARTVFAYEETARFYEMALQALQATDTRSSVVRCDLLLSLSEALGPAGEPQRLAQEVAEEAFTLAEELGDRGRAMRSAYLAIVQGLRRYGGGTVGGSPLMHRWVERLDQYAPAGTRERVEADLWMGIFLLAGEGRWLQGWERIDRARDAARQLQDAESLAFPVGLANWYTPARWEAGLAAAREASVISRDRVSARALAELLSLQNWTQLAIGDRDGAERTWQALAELPAQYREASLVLEPLSYLAHQSMLAGDLEATVAHGERIVARAEELGSPVAGRQIAYQVMFRPLLYLGRADEALATAFSARTRGGWSDRPAFFRVGERALCLAYAGQQDEALAQMLRDLTYVEISQDTPIRILAALLETAVLVRDQATATLLGPMLEGITAIATPLMSVALPVGAAAALSLDWNKAHVYYERALAWAISLRSRPEVARARLAIGELFLAQAQSTTSRQSQQLEARAEAFAHLDFAIEELRAMKMQPAFEHALRLRGHQRSGVASPGGLSRRELEVLRLVAAGKTNREIGDALVISLNTVVRHVSSIFAKTRVANRAEAASWAVRRGLA
jgi:DNA-binding CsgD family transcriptional regulator